MLREESIDSSVEGSGCAPADQGRGGLYVGEALRFEAPVGHHSELQQMHLAQAICDRFRDFAMGVSKPVPKSTVRPITPSAEARTNSPSTKSSMYTKSKVALPLGRRASRSIKYEAGVVLDRHLVLSGLRVASVEGGGDQLARERHVVEKSRTLWRGD